MRRITSLLVAAVLVGAGGAALLTSAASGASPVMSTIGLTMTGNSITVTGTPLSGAVNVTSTVTGVKQAEPTLMYLYPGVTDSEALSAAAAHGNNPNGLAAYGAIVFDAYAASGTSSAQTVLQPGHYLAFDTESGNAHSWPHADFDVIKAQNPAVLPGVSQSETAIDFAFRGNKHLHDGRMTRFTNGGFLGHEIIGLLAKNHKNAKKLSKLLTEGRNNQAKKLARGFADLAGPLTVGGVDQYVLNAKPGWYVLACFMNTQDGRHETQLGMARVVQILGS